MEKVKFFTEGVPVEDQALKQIELLASLPFVKHIAVMPDVHVGVGACVGTVIATDNIIIPSAVGSDIGCGMTAFRTSFKGEDLRPHAAAIRQYIEDSIPHGRSGNGGPNDIGRHQEMPLFVRERWMSLVQGYLALTQKYPQLKKNAPPQDHLGTLGTGNHFIEISTDEYDAVWVLVHSGSRGIGGRIGNLFTNMAKKLTGDKVPNLDLAYLPEDLSKDYMAASKWANTYAYVSRDIMATNAVKALMRFRPDLKLMCMEHARDCHHNFVAEETHFGETLLVTRKGSVRAMAGDLVIIPGSMGAKTYICRGKGNPESLTSCSHGAGRKMSRTQARKTISLEAHVEATSGVECSKDLSVLDESPAAYKNIEAVMEAQKALVEVECVLKQFVCVKGSSSE